MIEETEYEEIPGSTIEESIEEKRLEPWILEEFLPVFTELGLQEEDGDYVSRSTVQTGIVVINNVQRVQTMEQVLVFSFNPEMTASIDDSMLAGVDVELYSLTDAGKQTMFRELIYCTPTDFPSFYQMYVPQR